MLLADSDHDLCPMGCGRTTEDPYGGPCKACWDDVPSSKPEWDPFDGLGTPEEYLESFER